MAEFLCLFPPHPSLSRWRGLKSTPLRAEPPAPRIPLRFIQTTGCMRIDANERRPRMSIHDSDSPPSRAYRLEGKTRRFEMRPGSNTTASPCLSSMIAPTAPETPSKPGCGTSTDSNRIEIDDRSGSRSVTRQAEHGSTAPNRISVRFGRLSQMRPISLALTTIAILGQQPGALPNFHCPNRIHQTKQFHPIH